ncbi:MAG: hypothetical protein M4579_007110, partial [Chaenotheca gracillima]
MTFDDPKSSKRSLGNFSSQRAKKRPRVFDDESTAAPTAPHTTPVGPGHRTLRSRASFTFPTFFESREPPSDPPPYTPATKTTPNRRKSELLSGIDEITHGLRRLFRRPTKHSEDPPKRVRRTESFVTKTSGWFRHGDDAAPGSHHSRSRPMSSMGLGQHVRRKSSNLALLNVPPTITGGEAARAAAAEQNRRSNDLYHVPSVSDRFRRSERDMVDSEAESGIGIDLKDQGSQIEICESVESAMVRQDPLETLPLEVSSHILSLLDCRSLVQAEAVSREWNRVATSHHVWRDLFRREFRGPWVLPDSSPHAVEMCGRGMGKKVPDQDWKKIAKVKKALSERWEKGDIKYSKIEGHADSVYCVQFDQHKLITGSRDKTVRVWDLHTYKCIKVLMNPNKPIPYPPGFIRHDKDVSRCTSNLFHDASILCLQFDSDILVTGSSDFSAIIWSIKDDYKPIRRLQGHNLGVLDVSFDEKHIVTCSKDYT